MSIMRSPVDDWVAKLTDVATEQLTTECLEAYQLSEIRKMMGFLKKNSHFYREALRDVNPEEIRSFDDFRRLPTINELDLVDQEWRFQCVEASAVTRVVTVPTTGTTGKRKRISFTMEDLGRSMAFAPYGFHTMCEDGDKVLVMMSGTSSGSIGDNIRRGIEPLGMEVSVFGQVTDLRLAAQTVLEFQPDVIVAIPFHVAALARYMEQKGMNFQTKSVLLSADDVPEAICERLRRLWNCRTYRHYGMTELCMFGAVECMGQDGYHLRACDHLFEVIDPDENGFGEIAITTFHHQGMPLLRYRTGDIGRMKYSTCKCGSLLPRIETVRGRRSNSIRLSGGEVFIRDVMEAVFALPQVIDYECGLGEGQMKLVLRILKGDSLEEKVVIEELRQNPLFANLNIDISIEEIDGIPEDRDPKKRMVKL